jgi:heme/copper-type cytochrome/quinol oxidase subunit 2|uniref:Uncharacterized protein n=1 Tax=Panagrolaimus sp. PS1159 TaxID=55785 RepID=A0AC35FB33_9BILA
MTKDEMNISFLIFTACVFAFAILCVICVFCGIKCCRKKRNSRANEQNNPLIVTTKAAPIAVDTTDLDYIDSRDTKVISSTVQVRSLHNSPISSA